MGKSPNVYSSSCVKKKTHSPGDQKSDQRAKENALRRYLLGGRLLEANKKE